MATLQAIVGTTVHDLTGLIPGSQILWTGDDSLGMSPLHRITERGPQQHGDSDIDFRLDPRRIKLLLEILPSDLSGHYQQRATLLNIFRPSKTPVKLLFELDNGASRQIDAHIDGGMSFASDDRDGFGQRVVVELRCADPTFYDPVMQLMGYGIGGGSAPMDIPLAVPWNVGVSVIDQTRVIAYTGSWRSYPIIQINGPITNCVITNQTTGDKLDFTGTTIAAATTYTIDTRYGIKSVVDQTGANQISKLTDDSDLATFSLEADPDAVGGDNVIRVTGASVTNATEIYIQYYLRYIGF